MPGMSGRIGTDSGPIASATKRAVTGSPSSSSTVHVRDVSSHVIRVDAGVERDVAPEIESISDMLQVAQRLGLGCEVLAPVPVVEQLGGERVPVRVALRIKPGAGVSVPVPGAADVTASFERVHRHAELAQPVELIQP